LTEQALKTQLRLFNWVEWCQNYFPLLCKLRVRKYDFLHAHTFFGVVGVATASFAGLMPKCFPCSASENLQKINFHGEERQVQVENYEFYCGAVSGAQQQHP
jgi:uncharacterized Fe-S cluster-containing radical SAM superfamily protein